MAELWDSSCDLREIDDSLWPLFLSTAAVPQYEAFGAIFPISADSYLITPEAELCALKIEASQIITSDGLKPIVFQKLVTSAVGAKIFSPELKGLLFSVLGESRLRGELDFQNRVEHLVIFSQKGIELNGLTIKNVDKVSVISGNFFGYFNKGYATENELESLAISQFKDDLGDLVIKGLNTLKDTRLFGRYIDCEGPINGKSIDITIASKTKVPGGGFNNAKCVISAEDFFLSHDTKSRIELDLSLSSKNAVIKSYDEIEYRAEIKVKETLKITGEEIEVAGNRLIETSNLFIQASLFESPHPENIIVRDNFTLVLKDANDDYVGYWYGEKLATVGSLTSIICKYLWMDDSLTMGSLYLELHGTEESTLNIIYGSNKVILPTMNIIGSLTISVQDVDLVLGLIMATGKIEIHGKTLVTGYGSTFVSTESSLILESNSFDRKNFYGLFHGGELLQINCFEGINVYGRWSSNQEVYIQASYVDFYNQDYGLECGGKTTLKVYNFYMEASSKIRSKDLILENKAGGKLNKLWLKDAVIEVSGDARIRASEVLLQMVGLNIKEEFVSGIYFTDSRYNGGFCIGKEYGYEYLRPLFVDLPPEYDTKKINFLNAHHICGHIAFYKGKNIGTFGSLINVLGLLELDTNTVTLDKSFIKTGEGTWFINGIGVLVTGKDINVGGDGLGLINTNPPSIHIIGQVIKDKAFYKISYLTFKYRYWRPSADSLLGKLLSDNGYSYVGKLRSRVEKDSCIPAGIEGPISGSFEVVSSVCANQVHSNVGISSSVNPALIAPVSIDSSSLQVMQSYVERGVAIFKENPQIFPYEQYSNPMLELDLSYFDSPSYIKAYKALPGGEVSLDKYNYYYEKSYPSLFSCGIGIESILETLGVEKSSEILFGPPDIQLDIVNKLILKEISVHSLESVVEEVKHYFATYYKESTIGEKDCGQMHWLIQSALKQKDVLGLVVGVPLAENKYASITNPFIWLIYSDYQGVMLLTPVVYFNKEALEKSLGRYGAYISAPEGGINLEAGKMLSSGLISADDVKVDSGAFISVGTIEGREVGIKGKNIGIIGTVRAKDHLEVVAENQLIITSLKRTHEMVRSGYYNYISEVVKDTKLSSGGEVYLSSGDDLNIIGAGVVGQEVHLQSKSSKVVVVPLELYQKAITTGKRYYYEHQSLSYYQAKIEALKENEIDIKNGLVRLSKEVSQGGATGIIIEAGSGILLSGVNLATDRKLRLVSKEDDIKIETPEEYSSMVYSYTKKRGGVAGFFGGKKSISVREESYIPLDTQFIAGQVEFVSPKNIEIGVDIITYAVDFDREGATKDSMVKIIPKLSKYSYEVKTKKSGLMFSFSESGHLMLAGSKERIESTSILQVIPTIIQIGGISEDPEDKPHFIVYTKGGFVSCSGRVEEYRDENGNFLEGRKSQIIIEAEDIELESMPDAKFEFALLNEKGSGIGFSANAQEVALKAGIFGYKEQSTKISMTHKNPPGFLSQFLHLKSNSLRDVAAIYDAEQMDIHAKIIFHGVAKDSITESSLTRLMEAGVKLGVKLGSLGRMVDSATRMVSQDASTPEGIINSGFAGLQAYHEALKLLSGKGGMNAGIWAFAHYEAEKSSRTVTKEIPTAMKIGSLKIKTDDWDFIGIQIEAYRAYIKAKNIKSRAAEINSESSSSTRSFDIDIPLSEGVPGGLSFGASGSKSQERLLMNARIHIHEDLRLEVTGHADMRGITVSARSLEAFFNSLLLESVQDISKHSSWGAGLGLSSSDISSISGQLGKGNSHVVRELTSLIGEEKCHIVVANALRLNGAMIASAHRDANGQYSDHGKLTLRVGELFVQHIYDYDNGYTLGAAISSSAFMPTVGGHKGTGTTYGTIGKGEVECTASLGVCEIGNAYRDVSKPQSWSQDYDVDPITAYIPTGTLPELPKDDNGEINWEAAFDNVKKQFADVFKDLSKVTKGAFGLREVGVDFKEYSKGANSLEELIGKLEDLNNKIDSDINLTPEEKAEAKVFSQRLENYYNTIVGNAEDAAGSSPISQEGRRVIGVDIRGLKKLAGFVSGVFNDYAGFAEEHPHVAEYGLSAANLVIQTAIAGPLGAGNAVKGEFIGRAINEVAGEEINKSLGYVIEKKAKVLMEIDRNLHPIEALNLATAGLVAGYILYLGVSGVKDLIKTTSNLNKHGDIDYSSDIGSKFEGKVDVGTKKHSVKSEAAQKFEKDTGVSKTKIETKVLKAGTDAGGGFKHYIDIDANMLKREMNFPDDLNSPKLRKKFDSHAEHFGMGGVNFNKQNAELFIQKIAEHISHPSTVAIAGTYRTTQKVVHYFNPKTEINVMKDMNGNFISGWKLKGNQLLHIKVDGKIQ